MKKIGLTGGIGSGKSTVARLFEAEDIPVYFADIEAKKIMTNSSYIREKLTEKFGPDLYRSGTLNRQLLASLIFGDRNGENLKFVNSIVHPLVLDGFKHWASEQLDCPLVVIESAILFESGFNESVDFIVNVSAPESVRIRRIMDRDKLSREAILSRIRNQITDEERERRSGYTIINDGGALLVSQVREVIKIATFKQWDIE